MRTPLHRTPRFALAPLAVVVWLTTAGCSNAADSADSSDTADSTDTADADASAPDVVADADAQEDTDTVTGSDTDTNTDTVAETDTTPDDDATDLPDGSTHSDWCITSLAQAATADIPNDPPNPTLGEQPEDPSCTWPAPIFLDDNTPPTLDVTIGRREAEGAPWHTVEDGDWLGMWHGAQGSFHSFAVFRIDLEGVATPAASTDDQPPTPEKLQLEAWVADGCEKRAVAKQPVVWGYPAANPPASTGYVVGNTEDGVFGALLFYGIPSIESVGFCNAWMQVHVRVRHVKSGAWGEAVRWVRLYDTNP